MIQTTSAYNQALRNLNREQRRAVETIQGPVMVIAGPGTGKTQLLAVRIGYILQQSDVQPENILCITYTNAGVKAMRDRLLSLIGITAHRIAIYTYHAFCNDVILNHPEMFPQQASEPLSDLEKYEIIEDILGNLPQNHPLKRLPESMSVDVPGLAHFFRIMKQEGWTPEFIRESIDTYLDQIKKGEIAAYVYQRNGNGYKKGDLKQKMIDEDELRFNRTKATLEIFEAYQQRLKQNQKYDFEDMINWVVDAFREHEHLRQDYQERYQYILVDEYQDTSGAQNKLIEYLTNYEQPNILVVGDDDQSIYRFQGANVENMLEFINRFHCTQLNNNQPLKIIVLKDNYRSSADILKAASNLIQQNKERLINDPKLSLTKSLDAKINYPDHEITITSYPTPHEEMACIAESVKKLIDQQVKPGEIAIIYPENKLLEELAFYMQQKQIPFRLNREINILNHPLINGLLDVFRWMSYEAKQPGGNDHYLFKVLHFFPFKLNPAQIAELYLKFQEKQEKHFRFYLIKILNSNEWPYDEQSRDAFQHVVNLLEEGIQDCANLSPQHLFCKLLQALDIFASIKDHPEEYIYLGMLNTLFDFLKQENARKPELTFPDWIDTIDRLTKYDLPITFYAQIGNPDVVQLLTAHGAKGLEFDYVFVGGCVKNLWEGKRQNSRAFKLPPNIFIQSQAQDDTSKKEERRRLFYVAVTRARHHLHMSYWENTLDGKNIDKSMFLDEMDLQKPICKSGLSTPQQKMILLKDILQGNIQDQIQKLSNAHFLDNLIQNFQLNVTSLNKFLECPLKFFYESLLRVPQAENELSVYGQAIHFALKKMGLAKKEGQSIQLDEVYEAFEWYLLQKKYFFSNDHLSAYLGKGESLLQAYYESHFPCWPEVKEVEQHIQGTWNNIPLKGILDKVQVKDSQIQVVDYKTGKYKNANPKLSVGNGMQDHLGGDYWRQAIFYHLLLRSQNVAVDKVIFEFVEPDDQQNIQQEEVHITPDQVQVVEAQIQDMWQKLQNREFTPCLKPDCTWCQFHQHHQFSPDVWTASEEV